MRIDLPDLTYYHCFAKFSFFGLPTSNDFVVVGIESSFYVEIGVIKFGMDNWQIDEIFWKNLIVNVIMYLQIQFSWMDVVIVWM